MGDIAETDIDILIKNMEPILKDGVYVFHSSDMNFSEASKLDPIMIFRENEGTALILKKEMADQAKLDYIYTSRMITLNVHSSLDAIGFLAKITTALANGGISVNPVSAYFHDHLFVPVDKADLAMKVLIELTDI